MATNGRLHPVVNDTSGKVWCGLAAISAITGVPISVAKDRVRAVSSRRRIMGLWTSEVKYALQDFGYQVETRDNFSGFPKKEWPTLAAWLRMPRDPNEILLVTLNGHFVVIKGRKFIDSHTMEPVFIRRAPHRRKRVKYVHRVSR